MTGDEHAVLGRHEVGLDEVGALLDRQFVGRQRVFWAVTARTAVSDHERTVLGALELEHDQLRVVGRTSDTAVAARVVVVVADEDPPIAEPSKCFDRLQRERERVAEAKAAGG